MMHRSCIAIFITCFLAAMSAGTSSAHSCTCRTDRTPLMDRIEAAETFFSATIELPDHIEVAEGDELRDWKAIRRRKMDYVMMGEVFDLHAKKVWKGTVPDEMQINVWRSGSCRAFHMAFGTRLFYSAKAEYALSQCSPRWSPDDDVIRIIDAFFDMKEHARKPVDITLTLSSTEAPATAEITGPRSIVGPVAAYCAARPEGAFEFGEYEKTGSPVTVLWSVPERQFPYPGVHRKGVLWKTEEECRAFHLTRKFHRPGDYVLAAAIERSGEGGSESDVSFARSRRFSLD